MGRHDLMSKCVSPGPSRRGRMTRALPTVVCSRFLINQWKLTDLPLSYCAYFRGVRRGMCALFFQFLNYIFLHFLCYREAWILTFTLSSFSDGHVFKFRIYFLDIFLIF